MKSRLFHRALLIVCGIAVWLITVMAATTFTTAHAARHYTYELVRVHEVEAIQVVAARTASGWEPVSMSFYGTSDALGFILFRK